MKIAINLNDTFDVTLTERGARIYNDHYAAYGEARPEKRKAGDKITLELWNLMSIFGEFLYNGMPEVPFEGNVITRDKIS